MLLQTPCEPQAKPSCHGNWTGSCAHRLGPSDAIAVMEPLREGAPSSQSDPHNLRAGPAQEKRDAGAREPTLKPKPNFRTPAHQSPDQLVDHAVARPLVHLAVHFSTAPAGPRPWARSNGSRRGHAPGRRRSGDGAGQGTFGRSVSQRARQGCQLVAGTTRGGTRPSKVRALRRPERLSHRGLCVALPHGEQATWVSEDRPPKRRPDACNLGVFQVGTQRFESRTLEPRSENHRARPSRRQPS